MCAHLLACHDYIGDGRHSCGSRHRIFYLWNIYPTYLNHYTQFRVTLSLDNNWQLYTSVCFEHVYCLLLRFQLIKQHEQPRVRVIPLASLSSWPGSSFAAASLSCPGSCSISPSRRCFSSSSLTRLSSLARLR